MKLFSTIGAVAVLASALCLPGVALAQFAKPEDAVKYRQSAFSVMGTHFGRIGAMANGRVPFNAAAASANMAVVEALHTLPWAAFGPGTDVGTHRALPVVWSKAGEFKAAEDKMGAEVAKLSAAVKTGNLDQIKAAFGGVGASCKACHDNFRKE